MPANLLIKSTRIAADVMPWAVTLSEKPALVRGISIILSPNGGRVS